MSFIVKGAPWLARAAGLTATDVAITGISDVTGDYTISSNQSWATAPSGTQQGTGIVQNKTITVAANSTTSSRTATITVTYQVGNDSGASHDSPSSNTTTLQSTISQVAGSGGGGGGGGGGGLPPRGGGNP